MNTTFIALLAGKGLDILRTFACCMFTVCRLDVMAVVRSKRFKDVQVSLHKPLQLKSRHDRPCSVTSKSYEENPAPTA